VAAEPSTELERLRRRVAELEAELSRAQKDLERQPRSAPQNLATQGIIDDAWVLLGEIIDSSDDAIISKDLNGTIRSWNSGAERLFGYTAEEVIGQNISILAAPGRVNEFPEILQRIRRGERIHHYVTKRRTKDGRILTISLTVSPIKDAAGKVIGASKVARDITDRQTAQEALVRLGAILESSDDAIISKDLNGIIRSWNRGAERIFGYTAEEAIGQPVAMLAAPGRRDEIPNILDRIRRGERVDHYVTKRQTKDGRILSISLTVSPIKDASGAIVGASKIARDITEREESQSALRATNEALRVANADLEQFAYAAAHDLKEPLRMITIYSQLLEKRFADQLGPDGLKYLKFSIEGATRMEALVRDLLAYLQASTVDPAALQTADASKAVTEALSNLRAAIEESGASITWGSLPSVRMRHVHLQQLFQNLLGNAIKYRSGKTPEIVIGSRESSKEQVFFVADNGIGIRTDYTGRIFGLFRRLHTADEYPGSGIGLAICKRIVEHYGGRIWVESEIGVGSTFFFAVPV
jgi:PAS domain S-box-containing protein